LGLSRHPARRRAPVPEGAKIIVDHGLAADAELRGIGLQGVGLHGFAARGVLNFALLGQFLQSPYIRKLKLRSRAEVGKRRLPGKRPDRRSCHLIGVHQHPIAGRVQQRRKVAGAVDCRSEQRVRIHAARGLA
jgi:hypothetical protein